MLKNVSIGLRISLAFSLVLVIAIGAMIPVSINTLKSTIANAEDRELQSLFKNVKASIQSESRLAETLSAFVANMPSVQAAMADGDRQLLGSMLVPAFQVMKKNYDVRQFQFHTPPATSFFRVHKPVKFGDDLSSFRKTVVATNTTRRPVGGIEKGVAGLGVRGMVPVYHAGDHLGSVEFGMSFGQPFFEHFKETYKVDLALHVTSGDAFKLFASTLGEQTMVSRDRLQSVYNGQPQSFYSTHNDKPVIVFAGVVTDFSDQPIGVLEIVMDRSDYASALTRSTYTNLVVGIICLALGLLVAWWLARAFVRPIKGIVAAMTDIAEGEGDLTRRLESHGRNEISDLADAFNQFAEKVRSLVVDVAGATMQLSTAAQEMSTATDESNNSIAMQRSEIDQVATAMNEMTATVQEVAHNAADAAASARQADEEAGKGKQVVNESIAAINALAGEVERAAEVINGVEADSESIGTVLDVIRGIAEQTNLLALNAAIEAARAGEQGRGFAVVADEVRTLASRTQQSTQEIQQMIERLQTGSRNAVEVMQQGRDRAAESVEQAQRAGESLAEITSAITRINDMNTQIASAAEEQSSVAEEINRNIVNINDVADRVTGSASQTANASSELAELAVGLRNMVGRFKT